MTHILEYATLCKKWKRGGKRALWRCKGVGKKKPRRPQLQHKAALKNSKAPTTHSTRQGEGESYGSLLHHSQKSTKAPLKMEGGTGCQRTRLEGSQENVKKVKARSTEIPLTLGKRL